MAVVVAQFAEQSLSEPEDPNSNPVIDNLIKRIFLLFVYLSTMKNKDKVAGNGLLKTRRR